MTAHVYILRCSDGRYYVGSTRGELEKQVAEHNAGSHGGFTKARRPVTLVYHQTFDRVDDAIAAERRLKGWSRVKKEALIAGDFEALKRLARRGPKPVNADPARMARGPSSFETRSGERSSG